jgi:hypothetical protein
MSDFIDRCRQEWRRLGVPGPLADEMAADLASDVEEAESEGVTADELLGSDPRSFAASWAAERGIVRRSARRRPLALAAFTAVAATATVVAALLLLTGEPKVSLVASRNGGPAERVVQTSAAAPIEWILLLVALTALGFAAWQWSRRRRSAAEPAH